MNVLLVTGSRSLDLEPRAHSVAVEILCPLLAGSLLVCGDADGPDSWAIRIARELGYDYLVYGTDGWVYDRLGRKGRFVDARVHPLARNAEMVRGVAGLRGGIETLAPDGWTGPGYETRLLCVGFVDPASRTRGTDHTLRLARQAGIWCARYVWQGTEFVEESWATE